DAGHQVAHGGRDGGAVGVDEQTAELRATLAAGDMEADDAIERETCDEGVGVERSEEHTSELQSRENLVCRLLLEKKKKKMNNKGYKQRTQIDLTETDAYNNT